MCLIYIYIPIIIISIYLFYVITSLLNNIKIQSKHDSCFSVNMSNMNSYKLHNTLIVNTIVYDEGIPGYKIFGTGKKIHSSNFECLLFRSYKESKCTAYIQKIDKIIENSFIITVKINEIDFIPKYVMLNEYCLSLPHTISITKHLYNYTLCVIPEMIEKDEYYQKKWINYNSRIGIDKIVIYKQFNSNKINTYSNDLLDIIGMDKNYSTDLIMNDCFNRYRRLSKSILFMKMNDKILFLKTNNQMNLNNAIHKKERESSDIMYLCRCKTFINSRNISFSRLSKQNLKCEKKNSCSFIIVNKPLKFNFITQKGYYGDQWFYSKLELKTSVVIS